MKNITSPEQVSSLLLHPSIAEQLFDHLPDIVFFIKDSSGRYLVVNQTLVERCEAQSKGQIIGLDAAEVLGEELGHRYIEQDNKVLKSKKPLIQHLELHNYQSQELGWCLTTKIPLTDNHGACTGLIGISQDLKLPDATNDLFSNIHAAVKYVEENLDKSPTITAMAKLANMSHYQLDRRMKLAYGLSAGKWLIKTRVSQASQLLIDTSHSVLDIAFAVGYSDQSAFTKQFKKTTGVSPLKFKKINQKK